MSNQQAEFRRELEALLNKYSLDNRIGVPDFILAEMLISHLVTHQVAVREASRFFDRDIHSSELFVTPDPPTPSPHQYLVFSSTRGNAIQWSLTHDIGIKNWKRIETMEQIQKLPQALHLYTLVELDDLTEYPELHRVYQYAKIQQEMIGKS